MTKLPTISFKDLFHVVRQMGFEKIRQRGSHVRFHHKDGRRLTIPDHGTKDVPRGLLAKIIRYDMDISVEEFLTFYRE